MPCGRSDSLRLPGPPGRCRVTFRAPYGTGSEAEVQTERGASRGRGPGRGLLQAEGGRANIGGQGVGREARARGRGQRWSPQPRAAGSRVWSSGSREPAWETLTVQDSSAILAKPRALLPVQGGRQAEVPAPVSLSGGWSVAVDPGGISCVLSEPGLPSRVGGGAGRAEGSGRRRPPACPPGPPRGAPVLGPARRPSPPAGPSASAPDPW